MKRFLCFVILLLAVAAAVVAASRLRERRAILPFPRLDAEEEEPAGSGEAPAEPDDLAEVSGIGPVYRARLAEAGITTFSRLSAADADTVSAAAGVTAARAADWIAQAAARAAR